MIIKVMGCGSDEVKTSLENEFNLRLTSTIVLFVDLSEFDVPLGTKLYFWDIDSGMYEQNECELELVFVTFMGKYSLPELSRGNRGICLFTCSNTNCKVIIEERLPEIDRYTFTDCNAYLYRGDFQELMHKYYFRRL